MAQYTDLQYSMIQIATIASSSTSLTGSVFMGINILYDHPFLKGSSKGEQILFCMAIISTIGSFSTMQSIQAIGRPLLCTAQATIAEFALNALPLMNILHAINFWYILSGRMTPHVLFDSFLFASFLVPSMMAAFCFYFDMYGPTDISCWITPKYIFFRYALYYVPLFLDNVVGLFFIVIGLRKVVGRTDDGRFRLTNKNHIASAFKASLYGGLFIVILISLTAQRTYHIVYGHSTTPFFMVFLKTCFAPAQGFLNAFCYFLFRTFNFNETLAAYASNTKLDEMRIQTKKMGTIFISADESQLQKISSSNSGSLRLPAKLSPILIQNNRKSVPPKSPNPGHSLRRSQLIMNSNSPRSPTARTVSPLVKSSSPPSSEV